MTTKLCSIFHLPFSLLLLALILHHHFRLTHSFGTDSDIVSQHPAQGDRQKGLVCDKKGAQEAPFTEPILRAHHVLGGFSPLFPRPFVWENWDEAPQPELRAQRHVQGGLGCQRCATLFVIFVAKTVSKIKF